MKLSKTSYVILIGFVLLIGFFVKAVADKESTLANGKLVLLELAPVDPRSLMQGDYMDLRYAIAVSNNRILPAEETSRGYVLLELDANGVGKLVLKTNKLEQLPANHVYIKYYNNTSWNFNIGAESYFFQEGDAEKYEKAAYGGLKVDDKGNSVLIGLYDEHRKLIE